MNSAKETARLHAAIKPNVTGIAYRVMWENLEVVDLGPKAVVLAGKDGYPASILNPMTASYRPLLIAVAEDLWGKHRQIIVEGVDIRRMRELTNAGLLKRYLALDGDHEFDAIDEVTEMLGDYFDLPRRIRVKIALERYAKRDHRPATLTPADLRKAVDAVTKHASMRGL